MSNDKQPNLTDSLFKLESNDLVDMINNQFAELLKPKKFYPTVSVEYSPSGDEWEEIAETIWITALEGGCNHWIDYIHTHQNDLKCGHTVVDKNFDIVIHHGSDGWGDESEVDKAKAFDVIVDGIWLLDPERQRMALTVSELGQLDANDCDYIIQLGVFGKEVYC